MSMNSDQSMADSVRDVTELSLGSQAPGSNASQSQIGRMSIASVPGQAGQEVDLDSASMASSSEGHNPLDISTLDTYLADTSGDGSLRLGDLGTLDRNASAQAQQSVTVTKLQQALESLERAKSLLSTSQKSFGKRAQGTTTTGNDLSAVDEAASELDKGIAGVAASILALKTAGDGHRESDQISHQSEVAMEMPQPAQYGRKKPSTFHDDLTADNMNLGSFGNRDVAAQPMLELGDESDGVPDADLQQAMAMSLQEGGAKHPAGVGPSRQIKVDLANLNTVNAAMDMIKEMGRPEELIVKSTLVKLTEANPKAPADDIVTQYFGIHS